MIMRGTHCSDPTQWCSQRTMFSTSQIQDHLERPTLKTQKDQYLQLILVLANLNLWFSNLLPSQLDLQSPKNLMCSTSQRCSITESLKYTSVRMEPITPVHSNNSQAGLDHLLLLLDLEISYTLLDLNLMWSVRMGKLMF